MSIDQQPRIRLGFLPTPVTEMKRLGAELGGPRLFIKRDDQTGLALGGNKVRKLEFLIGEALALGADTLITGGAAQSNHCRQTAAAAAMVGLECHLALGGDEPASYQGNLLLDRLFGACLHWCGPDRKGERIPALCDELRSRGRRPYIIPYGGSSAIGAFGFVNAVFELKQQYSAGLPEFSHLVFASSSGGTHAGLIVGTKLAAARHRLIGIGIDKEDMAGVSLDRYIGMLADETMDRLGEGARSRTEGDEVVLETDYAKPGYGVVGRLEREAIDLVARREGILLDQVYTGRAMGGLIDLIRKGRFTRDDAVLFWHTGGTPALFSGAAVG